MCCTVTTPEPTRDTDCASIPIDSYLLKCSDVFQGSEIDRESLESAHWETNLEVQTMKSNLTEIQSEVDAVESRLEEIQIAATDRLDVVEADITASGERMDEFADAADTMQTGITANGERIDELANAADAVDETLESVQSDYDALVSRLEEIESWKETVITFSSAKGGPDRAETVGSYNGLASPDDKNTIIVALVVANVLFIIGCFVAAFTACFGAQRQVGYGKMFRLKTHTLVK